MTTATLSDAHAEHALTHLAARFEDWRQQRPSRTTRFPAPLWEQAMAFTACFSLPYVAKRLRLRVQDLQKRCAARPEAPGAPPRAATNGFVEVPPAPSGPLPTARIAIDLYRPDGTHLRITAQELHLPLTALVRAFVETP
jgi:hypothetical protein